VCNPINQQIVDEIQALIEKYADVRSAAVKQNTGEAHGA
jgi:hypothetical protein